MYASLFARTSLLRFRLPAVLSRCSAQAAPSIFILCPARLFRIIRQISRFSETVTVEFDEHRYVEYEFSDLDQLELAYAVTIHKAQGSEYPAVVIPLLRGPRMLMNRNLLYTAVTRARNCVVLIGDPSVMKEMIDNTSEARRYTTLALRLKECRDAAEGGEFCLK